MKRMGIAAGILLAILALSLLHGAYIGSFTAQLSTLLEEAETYARQGDWAAALERTTEANDRWERKDAYLHITLRHDQNDEITVGFRESLALLRCQAFDEYTAANARLVTCLAILADSERLTLQNIL